LQYNRDSDLVAVAPEEVASVFAVIPAPTWEERIEDDGWYQSVGEIIITALACVLITLSLGLIVFVIVKRNNQVLTAASPPFLVLILLASCFTYASTITWQLYATDAACAILPWLLGLGWTLFFG
jgi:7 transmembrane sweet-taste receptor of 3 GCPR